MLCIIVYIFIIFNILFVVTFVPKNAFLLYNFYIGGVHMMLDKLILGKKIKEARQRTGLNQSEFGKKVGISKQALSSIERGLYWPGLDTLENISALCGLTLNDFSDKFSNPHKILEEREEYNTFTDRERKLIHRFRLLRDDQKKALEILLHINSSNIK